MGHDDLMLKLNPTHTMLWRTPTSVQFGADEPVAFVAEMTTAYEIIITALSSGVSDVSLQAIAADAKMTPESLGALLKELGPALYGVDAIPYWRVSIDGEGLAAEALRELLTAGGHQIVAKQPDLAVIVGHHVLRPDHSGALLRRDIAHLPVVFGDTLVRIGPLVTPGSGPCLHCVYLAHAELDSAWHILATQLLNRRSHLETPRTSSEVAAMVSRWIDNAAGPTAPTGLQNRLHPLEGLGTGEVVILEGATGRTSRVTYRRRKECACQALPQNVISIASRRAGNPAPTTTPTGAFAPE
jgi:bacteriocin biosynthesis cyclodehydratase domain-containing protein